MRAAWWPPEQWRVASGEWLVAGRNGHAPLQRFNQPTQNTAHLGCRRQESRSLVAGAVAELLRNDHLRFQFEQGSSRIPEKMDELLGRTTSLPFGYIARDGYCGALE